MRNKIVCGHVLDILKTLPDCLVDCIVTSPPYWGLRDYGTEPVIWGGDPECEHEWGAWREKHDVRETVTTGKSRTTDRFYGEESRRFEGNHQKHTAGAFCNLCGAWRGSLGLEPTLDLYIEHLVAIFHEARRVLKDEGTLWLNMGDCYHSGNRGGYRNDTHRWENCPIQSQARGTHMESVSPNRLPQKGLKDKDLVGMPWRVAFALQADGWYLRSDIIWAKPNPMPESVSGTGYYRHKVRQIVDGKKEWVECPGCEKCNPHGGYVLRWNAGRPTKSHEYIFLLSKSAKYYYDAEAIKEPGRDWGQRERKEGSAFVNGTPGRSRQSGGKNCNFSAGRNKRTVWTIATQPFPEAHFATFPEKLIEPCIRAGTSEKGYCAECGKPWVRVIEKTDSGVTQKMADGWDTGPGGHGTVHRDGREAGEKDIPVMRSTTLGWQPSCSCGADTVPGLVCDPFGGSGTVALESKKLGRDYLLIELSPEYVDMANKRVRDKMGLFA